MINLNNNNNNECTFGPSYTTFEGNTKGQVIPLGVQETKNETNDFIDKPHNLDENNNNTEIMINYPPADVFQYDNSCNTQNRTY